MKNKLKNQVKREKSIYTKFLHGCNLFLKFKSVDLRFKIWLENLDFHSVITL